MLAACFQFSVAVDATGFNAFYYKVTVNWFCHQIGHAHISYFDMINTGDERDRSME